jgi:hypothetical protein
LGQRRNAFGFWTREHLGDTLDEHAAERGLEAWQLAAALRRQHGIEEVDTVWNFADGLERSLQKAILAKKQRQESGAKLMDKS